MQKQPVQRQRPGPQPGPDSRWRAPAPAAQTDAVVAERLQPSHAQGYNFATVDTVPPSGEPHADMAKRTAGSYTHVTVPPGKPRGTSAERLPPTKERGPLDVSRDL